MGVYLKLRYLLDLGTTYLCVSYFADFKGLRITFWRIGFIMHFLPSQLLMAFELLGTYVAFYQGFFLMRD